MTKKQSIFQKNIQLRDRGLINYRLINLQGFLNLFAERVFIEFVIDQVLNKLNKLMNIWMNLY